MNNKGQEYSIGSLIVVVSIIALLIGGIYLVKANTPWWAAKTGESELARAEQNRQITIKEAEAEAQAATSKAEAQIKIAEAQAKAEVIRAKGVAEANEIIGESLAGNEAYLTYLWIQGLHDGSSETIYIPTEANLPLLEARG